MEKPNALGRPVGSYDGKFSLSDRQVDSLSALHCRMVQLLMGWLDDDFRVMPVPDANGPMLGQHVVELLMASDARAFSNVCKRIVQTMLKETPSTNPFLAASMAEAGLTDNNVFHDLLAGLLKQQERNPFGLIPFATGFLNMGDQFSTLWALRILALSGSAPEHNAAIRRAIDALEKSFDLLCDHPDHIGFLLYNLCLLPDQRDKPLVDRCLDHLLCRDNRWQSDVSDLRSSGFVAYDLLKASGLCPKIMQSVESWLVTAFELTEEPPGRIPEPFEKLRRPLSNGTAYHPDAWGEAWLRALIAAGMYLRLRRPDYTPSSFLLTQAVSTANECDRLQGFVQAALPYLPAVQEIHRMTEFLRRFWQKAPYGKSVFIMRWMGDQGLAGGPNQAVEAIRVAICEELAAVGLVGRYVQDAPNYGTEIWANNEIYMRGCKHGIAVFERITRAGIIPSGPNHNVLVETGFMRGKGSRVLILYDHFTMDAPTQQHIPVPEGTGLPAILNGTIRASFDHTTADGMTTLRTTVRKWAESIASEDAKES